VVLERRARFSQVSCQLQSLRFASGKRRHRLPSFTSFEAYVCQWRQARRDFARVGKNARPSVTVMFERRQCSLADR